MNELQDMGHGELVFMARQILESSIPSRIIPRNDLIKLITGEIPLEKIKINPVDKMREELHNYIKTNKDVLKLPKNCDGDCWKHTDSQVIHCYRKKNMEDLTVILSTNLHGGITMVNTEDLSKLTPEDIEAMDRGEARTVAMKLGMGTLESLKSKIGALKEFCVKNLPHLTKSESEKKSEPESAPASTETPSKTRKNVSIEDTIKNFEKKMENEFNSVKRELNWTKNALEATIRFLDPDGVIDDFSVFYDGEKTEETESASEYSAETQDDGEEEVSRPTKGRKRAQR